MKMAENVVITMPVSDASKMNVKGKLLNEVGEMILEIEEMTVNLFKVSYMYWNRFCVKNFSIITPMRLCLLRKSNVTSQDAEWWILMAKYFERN